MASSGGLGDGDRMLYDLKEADVIMSFDETSMMPSDIRLISLSTRIIRARDFLRFPVLRAVLSEAGAKLRDWASVAGRGRLLLSGSVAHASLKTTVHTGKFAHYSCH